MKTIIIKWLIKHWLPGYHLHKDPVKVKSNKPDWSVYKNVTFIDKNESPLP